MSDVENKNKKPKNFMEYQKQSSIMELKIEKSVSQKLGLLQLRYQSMLQEFTDQPKKLQNGFFNMTALQLIQNKWR